MSEPKRQHYLPQFYLKGFACPKNEGQVFVLNKGHNRMIIQGVRATACREYIYSYRDDQGNLCHDIEKLLSKIERMCSPVLKKVLDRTDLSGEEEVKFAYFVAIMWLRVPVNVDQMHQIYTDVIKQASATRYADFRNHPEAFEAYRLGFLSSSEGAGTDNITVESLNPELLDLEVNWHATLLNQIKNAPQYAKEILNMGWTFLHSNNQDYFITSDYPFRIHHPEHPDQRLDVALKDELVEISLPLSRNMALFAGWKSQGRKTVLVNDEIVERINTRSVLNADMQVICPNRTFPGSDYVMRKFAATAPAERPAR